MSSIRSARTADESATTRRTSSSSRCESHRQLSDKRGVSKPQSDDGAESTVSSTRIVDGDFIRLATRFRGEEARHRARAATRAARAGGAAVASSPRGERELQDAQIIYCHSSLECLSVTTAGTMADKVAEAAVADLSPGAHRSQDTRATEDPRSMQAQVKEVLRKYGRTALVFHASLFATTLSGSYAAIRYGLDIEKYLDKIPFVDLSKLDPQAGSFALAYVSTLATGPARGAVTIGVTPILARWLARQGKVVGSSGSSAIKKTRK